MGLERIRLSSFYNPMLSANKHVVQFCRFPLSAAADGLADGPGELRTSPFNGNEQSWNSIERSLGRAVVPRSLPVSATTFPAALSCTSHRDACERISAIQAVLKGRTVAIWKGKIRQLRLFFSREACQRNATGWSTAGWPVNAKLQLLHRHRSISRSRRSSAKLLVFPCLHELVFYSPLSCTERTWALEQIYSWSFQRYLVFVSMLRNDATTSVQVEYDVYNVFVTGWPVKG